MVNNEEIITHKERVIKYRNNINSRYIKIPDGQFPEITHNDEAEVRKKETEETIYLIYVFKKKIKK